MTELDAFTRAYLECALWSSNDESTPSGGEPLDKNYGIDDLSPDTIQQAKADCERFQAENADDIRDANYNFIGYSDEVMAGHDFWLTRNGHGTGFWDRELGDIGDRLTEAAKAFGQIDLYVGDNGLIYS